MIAPRNPPPTAPPHRAFTLIELLVVISIIVLLLSLLAPAMDRAIEYAERVGCASNFRNFGLANQYYANEYKQSFVPIRLPDQGADPAKYYESWYHNVRFAEMMNVSGKRIPPYYDPNSGQWLHYEDQPVAGLDVEGYPFAPLWPGDMGCPSAPDDERTEFELIWQIQGFNWSGAPTSGWSQGVIIKRRSVESPASKAQMTDSNDWHVMGKGAFEDRADYTRYWDVHGDRVWATGYNGLVAYRHAEGANVAHFDGHVEYYAKDKAWEFPRETNAKMWDIRKVQ